MSATTPKKNRPEPQRPEESSAPPCPPPSSLSSESTCQLPQQLKTLRLPMFREHFQSLAETGRQETWSYPQYLAELTQRECQARDQRRIARLLAASKLPLGKTWEQFDWKRMPEKAARHLRSLRDGAFLERATNVLLFGRPGSGKTHALAALGEQLARQGRSVLFTSCSLLVQDLLAAKRDLKLHRLIKRLQAFEALIIDDLGYVQQSREEMEVLFTLLAERYERTSVLLSSNLPFSQWEQIFRDPMTTAAAIDRLVHHSVIVELNIPSYRLDAAKRAQSGSRTTTTDLNTEDS
jgi:DNA replication protein DnaC